MSIKLLNKIDEQKVEIIELNNKVNELTIAFSELLERVEYIEENTIMNSKPAKEKGKK
jgi:hypothetical protein